MPFGVLERRDEPDIDSLRTQDFNALSNTKAWLLSFPLWTSSHITRN